MRRFVPVLTIPCAFAAVLALTAAAPAADTGGKIAQSSGPDGAGKSAASPTADSGNGAAEDAGSADKSGATNGAAAVSGPDEPATHLTPPLPPLHLTDAQRQKIRQAVADKNTEVTFQLKGTKPHKDFTPSIGAKIPPQLPPHALPPSLTQDLTMLADYKYMKVKGQVLIVNPMTKKIVDMFPEKQG